MTPPQSPTSTSLARRTVLAAGGAGSAAIAVGSGALPAAQAARARHDVFAHGVASGDPLPRAVLIWTRVTPTRAATPGSRKGPRLGVRWEVATDRRFRDVVRRGRFVTSAARDHTVKLDVRGVRLATTYYYRFTAGGHRNPCGTTRTA
ncbi:PhoD-like phosphatase N-terminal domain-containing protein, partial [Nocardioides salarius]|uniref:PhoD-like phosphatase N-terminal domain-containing protein n=1 Tax=Nocardioides salarius TaxID=374513 RepID=UPI0030F747CD